MPLVRAMSGERYEPLAPEEFQAVTAALITVIDELFESAVAKSPLWQQAIESDRAAMRMRVYSQLLQRALERAGAAVGRGPLL